MSEWSTKKIEECAEILDHLRIPVNEEERSANPGTTPYFGANGIQGYINGWLFDEPLILMAEDGGYFEDFATRPIAYRISGKSWVNNHAHILRPKPNICFNYLFYSLEHKNITPFIKGGTRAKLNQKELREVEILVPTCKDRQKNISLILQTIDKAIEQTEALIEKYRLVKAGMMHDLFTRGLTADGKLRTPREEAPDLYQETPIGWIPKDWDFTTCGDVCEKVIDCKNRTPPVTADGHPVIRTPNVRDGEFVDHDLAMTDPASYQIWTARGKPKPGDIVITREAPVGEVCKIPARHDQACLGQRMMLYRTDDSKIENDYFLYALQCTAIQSRLDLISGGSTVGHVRVGDIRELWMIAPKSKDEQNLIAKGLNRVTSRLRSEMEKRDKLKKQKSGLMHDLLIGIVPVEMDDAEATHV